MLLSSCFYEFCYTSIIQVWLLSHGLSKWISVPGQSLNFDQCHLNLGGSLIQVPKAYEYEKVRLPLNICESALQSSLLVDIWSFTILGMGVSKSESGRNPSCQGQGLSLGMSQTFCIAFEKASNHRRIRIGESIIKSNGTKMLPQVLLYHISHAECSDAILAHGLLQDSNRLRDLHGACGESYIKSEGQKYYPRTRKETKWANYPRMKKETEVNSEELV